MEACSCQVTYKGYVNRGETHSKALISLRPTHIYCLPLGQQSSLRVGPEKSLPAPSVCAWQQTTHQNLSPLNSSDTCTRPSFLVQCQSPQAALQFNNKQQTHLLVPIRNIWGNERNNLVAEAVCACGEGAFQGTCRVDTGPVNALEDKNSTQKATQADRSALQHLQDLYEVLYHIWGQQGSCRASTRRQSQVNRKRDYGPWNEAPEVSASSRDHMG